MAAAAPSDQIRQMVNFILQEAHEKANEIRVKVRTGRRGEWFMLTVVACERARKCERLRQRQQLRMMGVRGVCIFYASFRERDGSILGLLLFPWIALNVFSVWRDVLPCCKQ